MTSPRRSGPDLRSWLRRPGDALPRASIGTVPILWNNVDVEELRLGTDAPTLLDEIARVGYEGTQLGAGLSRGCRADGAAPDHAGSGWPRSTSPCPRPRTGSRTGRWPTAASGCACSHDGDGDVLCVALDGSPERDAVGGPGRRRSSAPVHRRGLDRPGRRPPRAGGRDDRRRPSARLPSARRDVHRDAGRGRAAGGRHGPGPGRDLPRRRALPDRWRRSGQGAARAGRPRHACPPEGRRSVGPRAPRRAASSTALARPSGRASSPSSVRARWTCWVAFGRSRRATTRAGSWWSRTAAGRHRPRPRRSAGACSRTPFGSWDPRRRRPRVERALGPVS